MYRLGKQVLSLGIVLVATLFSAALVQSVECGQTPVDHCTISQNTTFTSGTHKIYNITFVADAVTLDCNGALITARNATNSIIYVGGTSDVTIYNCDFVDKYKYAITNEDVRANGKLLPVHHLTIRDNTFRPITSGDAAILLSNQLDSNTIAASPAINHQIVRNTITNAHTKGIMLVAINNSKIERNSIDIASTSNDAIYGSKSSNNIIKNNTLQRGKLHLDQGATNNTIFLNTFENIAEPVVATEGENTWQAVVNVLGQDRTLGNFYDIYYKDNHCVSGNCCTDSDVDNVCDAAFLFTNESDSFALRSKFLPYSPPPIIQPIAAIEVNASQVARVTISASSTYIPLAYKINDSRFKVGATPNTFTWQTNLSDIGNYTFKAIVTDAVNLNSVENFIVRVMNATNQTSNESRRNCNTFTRKLGNNCFMTENTTLPAGPRNSYQLPDGITIAADDITLNCNDSVLVGGSTTRPTIYVGNTTGVTITNCRIINVKPGTFEYLLSNEGQRVNGKLLPVHQLVVKNNIFTITGGSGAVYLTNRLDTTTLAASPSENHQILENTITGTTNKGIALIEVNNSVVINNSIAVGTGNDGIYLGGASHTLLRGNSVSAGKLQLAQEGSLTADNNTLFLNIFDDGVEQTFDNGSGNRWYTAVNAVGGNRTLGNFYAIYYKDTQCRGSNCCTDADFDNVCDDPYVFTTGQDTFALRSKATAYQAPPVIQPIVPIVVAELNTVHVIINASGFGSSFFYRMNDSRFKPVGGKPNEFIWNTALNDAGNYTFKAIVLDTLNLNSAIDVAVTVTSVNKNCNTFANNIRNKCFVLEDTTLIKGTYQVPDGIRVAADNVQLDCNDSVLIGSSNKKPTIYVGNTTGVTIINCNIGNYTTAIGNTELKQNGKLRAVQKIKIRNNTFRGKVGSSAIFLTSKLDVDTIAASPAVNHQIRDNMIMQTHEQGIVLVATNNSQITNNYIAIASPTKDAILLNGSSDTFIRNNTIRAGVVHLTDDGTQHAYNNTLFLNRFTDAAEPVLDTGLENNWHAVIGAVGGPRPLGNFYDGYYKDTQCRGSNCCTDADFDNVCDDPYVFTNAQDAYALRSPFVRSNAPPAIKPIQDIHVVESQIAVVVINATGFNATLAYRMNDSRFTPGASSNIYEWRTTFTDAGTYAFKAIVTDALRLNSAAEVRIFVNESPSNRCRDFPNKIANRCRMTTNISLAPGTYQIPDGIVIAADNVRLNCNGATLVGSDTSTPTIFVGDTSGVVIHNCHIQNYGFGISNNRAATGYFTIKDNVFESNTRGTAIRLDNHLAPNSSRSNSLSHIIINNTIIGEHKIGIIITKGNGSHIADNNISTNDPREVALHLAGGSNNIIERNMIVGGGLKFERGGIKALDNTIQDNTLEGAAIGIEILEGVENTKIKRNTLKNTRTGMKIRAHHTLIKRNNFDASNLLDTTDGIILESVTSASHNIVFLNNFDKVTDPAYDGGSNNTWNDNDTTANVTRRYGNFYDFYSKDNHCINGNCCTDKDFDNVCDDPYVFSGGQDAYALRSRQIQSNSPPLIDPILPITKLESEGVHVIINATSLAPNQTFTYRINDTRRFKVVPGKPNEFIWQTNFKNAGTYGFNAIVTDSFNLHSAIPFTVTIKDANDDCSAYPNRIANGCVVKSTITFPTGKYFVPDGITVEVSDVVVDCNGAVMEGDKGVPITGISIINQNKISLQNCNLRYFGSNGLDLISSHNIDVKDSNFSANADTGIQLRSSSNNVIEGNDVSSNENRAGIELRDGSNNNTIKDNTINNNDNGGIRLSFPRNIGNIIVGNTVERTKQNGGIFFASDSADNTLIYHNNLINNNPNVLNNFRNNNNQWHVKGEGNYYSDHLCIGNWICSNAYISSNNRAVDKYPLRYPSSWLYTEPYMTIEGSGKLGEQMNITLHDDSNPNNLYLVLMALGNDTGILFPDRRIVPVNYDIVFELFLAIPQGFGVTPAIGTLDANGEAKLTWIPPKTLPQMKGLTFHLTFVSIDLSKPYPATFTGIGKGAQVTII